MTHTLPARDRDAVRYQRILDATVDAVFVVDPTDLTLEYANRGLAEHVGGEVETLVGAPLASILDGDPSRLAAAVADVLRAGRLETVLALRRVDGATVPVDVVFERVDLGDEDRRVVVVARDVSERVEAEARLQRLAESEHARAAELNAVIRALGDGVLVVGPGGRIRLANPAARRLVPGVATYAQLLAALDDPRRLAPELGHASGPVELRLPGATDRWLELSTYPVPPPGARFAEPAETIVLLRDVTLARRGRASRETFVHMLSHELRTPVTTIYGAAQVLWRRGRALDQETRRTLLADIHAEAERLHRLIEDVIALTRFGEDDASVGVEPVLLQRVLPGVAASEEARWPGMHVRVRIGSGVPTVRADRTYVEQVVRNLLSNAAKYAGPDADVELVVDEEPESVVVRVLDRGPGFGTPDAARLFDLYYRSPESAPTVGGAGIGLFVCARLVEAMGGRIWARPRAEGGAEFAFSLPVLREDEAGG